MVKRKSRIALMVTLLSAAATSQAGVIDSSRSYVWAVNEPGRIFVAPNGGGESFVDAQAGNNYMVTVLVMSTAGGYMPGIPATDIWLGSGSLFPCDGVFMEADGPTNYYGATTITGTMMAGVKVSLTDCSDNYMRAYVRGVQVSGEVEVAVSSPDLNGDGSVSVADFGLWAGLQCSTPGSCNLCGDYNKDGLVTVADMAILSSFIGTSCQ